MIRGLVLVMLCLAGAASLQAGDDQDRARAALERGEIRPLGEVLAALKAARPGEVLKVELKRDDGRWEYEFKVLTPDGKRREVEIDAKSLKILDDDAEDDD